MNVQLNCFRKRPISYVYIKFLCKCFENIIKDQVTLNKCSIYNTGRVFGHNFECPEKILC